MAAYNTQVISDVIDFTVEEYAVNGRGALLFHVDYANETKVMSNAERLDVTGGIGGFKLASIDHSASAEFNAVLPLVDYAALGVKLGRALAVGANTTRQTKIYTVTSDAITLDQSALDWTALGVDASAVIKVYEVIGDRDIGTELTQVDATPTSGDFALATGTDAMTFFADEYVDGTKIMVSLDYTTGANTKEIKLTANNFPTYIRITGRGATMDEVTGDYVPITFDVKKAKVKPGFELSMANGTATNVDFSVDCYTVQEVDDKVFITILSLEDEV